MSTIPGLHSLGECLYTGPAGMDKPLTDEQTAVLKEASKIAENAITIVAHGIAGIGHVLGTVGDQSDGSINMDLLTDTTLSDLGWFLEDLGMLVVSLDTSRSNINYTQAQHAALTGKPPSF